MRPLLDSILAPLRGDGQHVRKINELRAEYSGSTDRELTSFKAAERTREWSVACG